MIIGSGWDEEDMTAIHLMDFLYLIPISTRFLNVNERQIVWGLILVPIGRADLESRRIEKFQCGRESALKNLQCEYEEFRKLSQNSGSTKPSLGYKMMENLSFRLCGWCRVFFNL